MSDIAWTCVVAEDEALLRRSLLDQLQRTWPALRVVAECEDGASALEAIAEHRPEVAFLDIRMPGLSGLEVAAAAAEASPGTRIVFVTAYDQYAVDAFERGAIDYLLKPIAPERLDAAADLAHRQCRPRDAPGAGGGRGLFPRRQQVHDGSHGGGRGPAAHADP